jgi:hypothetical protein
VGKELLGVWDEENGDPKAECGSREEGERTGNEHNSF